MLRTFFLLVVICSLLSAQNNQQDTISDLELINKANKTNANIYNLSEHRLSRLRNLAFGDEGKVFVKAQPGNSAELKARIFWGLVRYEYHYFLVQIENMAKKACAWRISKAHQAFYHHCLSETLHQSPHWVEKLQLSVVYHKQANKFLSNRWSEEQLYIIIAEHILQAISPGSTHPANLEIIEKFNNSFAKLEESSKKAIAAYSQAVDALVKVYGSKPQVRSFSSQEKSFFYGRKNITLQEAGKIIDQSGLQEQLLELTSADTDPSILNKYAELKRLIERRESDVPEEIGDTSTKQPFIEHVFGNYGRLERLKKTLSSLEKKLQSKQPQIKNIKDKDKNPLRKILNNDDHTQEVLQNVKKLRIWIDNLEKWISKEGDQLTEETEERIRQKLNDLYEKFGLPDNYKIMSTKKQQIVLLQKLWPLYQKQTDDSQKIDDYLDEILKELLQQGNKK